MVHLSCLRVLMFGSTDRDFRCMKRFLWPRDDLRFYENELKTLIRPKGLGIYFDQHVERITLCMASPPYEGLFRAICLVGLLLIWIQLTEGVVPLEGWIRRGSPARRDTF
ncbi:hypothetical protein M9H77_33886 [Catharanthus roseus]|uniref:Uncharacterized protein n=1 Tax=Catharanthus roseus TaxID=4058 RepID=A0ACB9ZKT4_CATRO|nr:hypothetical protein M9H77_33886 [Catharanthus roseus]